VGVRERSFPNTGVQSAVMLTAARDEPRKLVAGGNCSTTCVVVLPPRTAPRGTGFPPPSLLTSNSLAVRLRAAMELVLCLVLIYLIVERH
jgi:hypothetical protein